MFEHIYGLFFKAARSESAPTAREYDGVELCFIDPTVEDLSPSPRDPALIRLSLLLIASGMSVEDVLLTVPVELQPEEIGAAQAKFLLGEFTSPEKPTQS